MVRNRDPNIDSVVLLLPREVRAIYISSEEDGGGGGLGKTLVSIVFVLIKCLVICVFVFFFSQFSACLIDWLNLHILHIYIYLHWLGYCVVY